MRPVIETGLSGFDLFWRAYPKRVAKADARRAWLRLNPSEELIQRILKALEWQSRLEQWQRDDGQFIPYPASYLRGERWDDEPKVVKPAPAPRQITPCKTAGCKGEGAQIWRGLCQTCYAQSKPARAA